jgi:hypothetical protein
MGVTNFDVVQANAFIGAQDLPLGGTHYFVRPKYGLDDNSGRSPRNAFKTLARAYAVAASGKNDIVHFIGEGNAASLCTDYQSALLTWGKDLLHLVGEGAGTRMSPRCRVGFLSTYAAATGLFKVSGNGCIVRGMQFWGGLDGSALPLGAVEVTGRMNRFQRCHIAGMNGAAAENDILGAYSLKLTGAIENEFEDCVIGSLTNSIGAYANSQILFATLAQENLFRRCSIVMQANHATNHVFLRAPTGSGVCWNEFEDCEFINTGTTLTASTAGAFVVATDHGGLVLLRGPKTSLYGANGWGTNYNKVLACGYSTAAATFGFSTPVTA